ncbi:MAG: alcohol dehydrogenase-like regulatory protein ErcA [Thermodesulfovibrionales bacterium]
MVGKELSAELTIRKFVIPEFVFGVDAIKLTGKYSQNFGARRVLVVTDNGVISHGWTEKVCDVLKDSHISHCIFSGLTENPKDYEVMQGVDFYKSEGCDVIVAVGGGSVLDCAKGIAIVSSNGGDIKDFEGVDKVTKPMPPLICIPTTAGSSADVSQFAIITDTKRMLKFAIISKTIIPDVALIDPVTTTTMDRELTAHTGLDALCHAFEAFVSVAHSPITDLHALYAIRLIFDNLPHAINNPDNLDYRGAIMLGSLSAGLAFSNASLGLVHAMAHAIGALLNIPHGCCNAHLLPLIVRYNFDSAPDRYRQIAHSLDITKDDMSDDDVLSKLDMALLELLQRCGINLGLGKYGLSSQHIPSLAEYAINDPCIVTNPKIPTVKDIIQLYESAI